jgi:hypothetical protein
MSGFKPVKKAPKSASCAMPNFQGAMQKNAMFIGG